MASENNGMLKLLEIINKLQDACAEVNDDFQYDLPQIAVVGCQSAGKSSVLENIVGEDFLPRGSGVVTRRPLILQLVKGPEKYGEFSHCKEKKFTDFNKIRDEIVADTDRVAGTGKGMSKEPISLRIYSPNVLNLTLIDLPGITKVPLEGQPVDIEQQTKDMILEFITKENCLILAVSPATTDLVNSDALKLAGEVDEKGDRTIGVITKLDLMDKGTNARDILENKLLPLRRGYVGVVNRSQADINGKKSIKDAQNAETDFFESHPDYKHMAERMGTSYLQMILSQQLGKHILEEMPKLQDKLQTQLVKLRNDIEKYTESYPADIVSMIKLLGIIIDELKENFKKEIGDLGAEVIETEQLSSGTKINGIFFERFPKDLLRVSCDEEKLRAKIDIAIRNINGVRANLYAPHMAFESIVKEEILQLKDPIRTCVGSVVELLSKAIRKCTRRIADYPKIQEDLEKKIMSHIHSDRPKYERKVLALIDMEIAYQNTKHEDFKPTNADSECQGMLCIENLEKIKSETTFRSPMENADDSYWFELQSNTLSCYRNADHDDEKFTLALNGFKVRDAEDGDIDLFNPNRQKLKHLRLSCLSDADFVRWKESFDRVLNKDELQPGSLLLKKEIDDFHEKINQYMDIVRKNARDMVPKAIKLYIIDKLKAFIDRDLAPTLFDPSVNLTEKFAMDPDQAKKLTKKKKMLAAYQTAVNIIQNIPTYNLEDTISNEI